MPEDVMTAEPVAASPAPAPTPAAEPTSFAEVMKSWTPAQREEWDRSGKEPEPTPAPAAAPAESTEKKEPSAPKGETEAVTEPAEDDQELPEGDTAEARRARNRMFAKLRTDRAALKAENDLLKSQRLEKPARTTESAPAPKAEPKTDTAKFTFREPNDTETYGEYLEARDEALLAFSENRVLSKLEQKKAQETAKERETRLVSEYDGRRKALLEKREGEATEDHRVRTLEYANAARWTLNEIERADAAHVEQAILESEHGPRLTAYFGTHQKEFSEILRMTPHRALLAIGKVEAQYDKSPDPKPITVTRATPPAERVNATSAPAKDPIEQAEADYDRTGDHKYLRLMNELMDKRDAEARRR